MPLFRHAYCRVLAILTVVAVVGCSSKPAGVKAPQIDPTGAANALMARYDTDSDGQLSQAELSNCTALLDALNRYDENGDLKISGEELTKRFTGWLDGGLGISSLACRVTFRGRPLKGAEISFVPDPCFKETLQRASGTTDDSGVAMLSIDPMHMPADAHNMRGVQQGLFRVEITHPTVTIPGRYNVETQLGKEVSFELGENVIRFKL